MRYLVISVLVIFLILFESCGSKKVNHPIPGINGKEVLISRAERFTLEVKNGYTDATIIDAWQGANNVNQVYHLVKKGSIVPKGFDSSSVIFVPLKKIICMSNTYIGMISALGEENSIVGVSGTGFIFSPVLIKNVEKGLIQDVGYDANLNKELILKISPDVIRMYGIGSESVSYTSKIKELGVKVVFNADYLETDPLGKAEWIKFFGALYCKEELADSIFKAEVDAYTKLKSFIYR